MFQHKKQLEKKDKLLEEKIKENEGLKRDLNEAKQELTNHFNEVTLKIYENLSKSI